MTVIGFHGFGKVGVCVFLPSSAYLWIIMLKQMHNLLRL